MSLPSTRIAARVGPVEACDEPQRGRLAAAGRAEQREELALAERDVDAVRAPSPCRSRGARSSQLEVRHLACSCDHGVRAAAFAADDEQREHRRPGDREARAASAPRAGYACVSFDVLEEDREGMELREVRDRELAHHDRERRGTTARAPPRGCSGGSRAASVVAQLAPRLCDASVSVWTSIARKPASSEKNMYGNARITYAATRNPHGSA